MPYWKLYKDNFLIWQDFWFYMQTWLLRFLSFRPTYLRQEFCHTLYITSHRPFDSCIVSQRSWFVVDIPTLSAASFLESFRIRCSSRRTSRRALEGARVSRWRRWVIDAEGGDSAVQDKENGGENMCPWRMYWCLLLWHLIMFWVYGLVVLSSCVTFHLPLPIFLGFPLSLPWYVCFVRPGPVFPLCFLIFASWSFVLCWFVVCSVFCSWINLVLLSDNRTGLSYLWKRTEKGHCPVCVSTELKSFGSVFVVFCVFVYTVCRFILSPTDRMGTCRFLWNTSPDKFSEEQQIKTKILRAACIKGMCLWCVCELGEGKKRNWHYLKTFPSFDQIVAHKASQPWRCGRIKLYEALGISKMIWSVGASFSARATSSGTLTLKQPFMSETEAQAQHTLFQSSLELKVVVIKVSLQ